LAQILDSLGKVRIVLIVIVALGIVSAYQCAEQFFVSNAITIEQYEKDPNMLLGPLGIEPGTFQQFLFEHRLYSRGIRGFFTTSNSAASFAICAAFAGIALLAGRLQNAQGRTERVRHVGFTLIAVALIVAGLFLTQSKGGILAFLAGLAVFGFLMAVDRWFGVYRRHARLAGIVAIILGVVVIGCIAVQYGVGHGRLPGGNSMLVRWQYWTASARMYADHPITGVGPGNFSDYYTQYKPAAALESVADPHDWPLSLLTQFGPLGLIGFLAMLCLPLWRSILPAPPDLPADDVARRPVSKGLILAILLVLGLCLLLIRPLLIPTSGSGDPDVWLYEVITLFVTPTAAFLIGFLLVAAPFEPNDKPAADLSRSALSAALVAAILAVLLHNLIDFALFEPGVWTAFWMLLACLAAVRSCREPVPDTTSHRSPRLRWLVALTAFSLLGVYVLWVWVPVYRMAMGIAKSQQAVSSGRFDLAHDALGEAIQADPLSPAASNINGRLYLQQYDQMPRKSAAPLERAAICFEEAIARSPADYKNYEKLALTCDRLGRPQEAYNWYLKAARLYPGNERLWFELGRLAERMDRLEAALGHYRQAVEIEDGFREQFRRMYPGRKQVVSRLGERQYRLAQERIAALTPDSVTKPPLK
jgi:tetratricopeptide (TPR) repeat protein/O-antigen ligase